MGAILCRDDVGSIKRRYKVDIKSIQGCHRADRGSIKGCCRDELAMYLYKDIHIEITQRI